MTAKKRQPRSRQPQSGEQELPHLPEPVLTAILQNVPLRQRLTAASLVCTSWARAVASTTADVYTAIVNAEGCSKMQHWLQLAGGQVSSLALYSSPSASQNCLVLPCGALSRLESLALSCLPVMFNTQQQQLGVSTRSRQRASVLSGAGGRGAGAASSLRAAAAAAGAGQGSCLPALRELMLNHCQLRLDGFAQLCQSLTGLTQLHLNRCTFCTPGWAPAGTGRVTRAVKAALQQLQGLEELALLDGVVLGDTEVALAPLSTMQRLQRVAFSSDACSTAALAHLPPSLTALDLRIRAWGDPTLLAVNAESLPPLPHLCELYLLEVQLDPRVLARWSGLQRLVVMAPLLHGPGLLGAQEGWGWDEQEQLEAALLVFLRELGKLKQLQAFLPSAPGPAPHLLRCRRRHHWHCCCCCCCCLQELCLYGLDLEALTDGPHLTALTASPQLTSLTVHEGTADEPAYAMPLPRGALRHMLAQGRQWPLLTQLRLEVSQPDLALFVNEWCVDTADVARMANCLPALSSLFMVHVLRGSDAVAPLTRLACLTQLAIGGRALGESTARHLAKMASLSVLEWVDSSVTSLGLLQLTALTNLDVLEVHNCPRVDDRVLAAAGEDESIEVYRSPEAVAAGTHDVWQQLRELCLHDPACQRAGSRAAASPS